MGRGRRKTRCRGARIARHCSHNQRQSRRLTWPNRDETSTPKREMERPTDGNRQDARAGNGERGSEAARQQAERFAESGREGMRRATKASMAAASERSSPPLASAPASASSKSSPPTSATRTPAGRMPEPPMNFWPGARAPASRRSAPCSRCARLTFGARPLLSGATLAVAAGDRNCLVRRNGIVSCG
jgi:hypothetical protein